ncbi:unnamed protein product, partial [Rotaria sordida]
MIILTIESYEKISSSVCMKY